MPGLEWKTAGVIRNKEDVLGEKGDWMGPEQREHFCGEGSTGQCCWHSTGMRRDQELLHRGLKGAQETPSNVWLCMRSHQQEK